MKKPARLASKSKKKFAKLHSPSARFANFSRHPGLFGLAAITIAAAGLVIVSGLLLVANRMEGSEPSKANRLLPGMEGSEPSFGDGSAIGGPFLPFQQALESMQAQLTQVSSPTKLGKSGILTITDSGIIKPTDHNQTQGGIGTDVSRIGKIWGTFMDLKDDVSINGKLDLSGKLTANGVVVLGNNDGDTIEVGGRFTSNLVPSQTNAVDLGTTSLRWRTGYFVNSIVIGSGTTTITDTGITTTGGSSTSITSSLLKLVSTGTLQLDTSTNNTNILLLTGSGNVGVGSTAPGYTLDVSGTGHYTGAVTFDSSISVSDLSCTDCLDFDSFEDSLDMDADTLVNGDYSLILRAGAGAVQNSTSGSNDLQLSAEDRLDLYAASYSLTTSGNSVDILSAGRIDLSARGTLTLDTSQNNTNILLKAGSGSINLSSGTTTISGNVNLNSGTLTLNGVAYTFPGADGSASNALTTNGTGLLSWGTLGAASITADSLDFAQFDDSLDLDADTSINGPYSFIVRAGSAARQNAASGSNDLQLSAEDQMFLHAGGLLIETSSVSAGQLVIRSDGTLQLDTSANNTNLLVNTGTGILDINSPVIDTRTQITEYRSGTVYLTSTGSMTFDTSAGTGNFAFVSGNVGIGSTAPAYKLDVNGTLRTTSTARVEGALTVTTGGASVTGDLTLDGDLDFTGPQNITTTADDLTLSPTGNLRIDTTGGTVKVSDTLEVGDGGVTNYASFSTTGDLTLAGAANNLIANNDLVIRSGNSLTIDTSANNTNLVLQGGTGGLTGSFGTLNLTAVNDSVSAVYLNAQRGGITLSSSNASGNGPIKLLSGGSLQLSTSQGNQPIYLQAGTGNVNVSSTQLYLTGNLVVTGTETFNGVAYTFPGADGSASNVLTTSGTGLLSWGTLGAASITADSLDFTEFQDSLDLDADTSINGPFSFIIRTGNAARQNATSGNNDLQLSAEDQILIDSAGLTLATSNADAVLEINGDNDFVLRAGDAAAESTANNNDIFIASEDDTILRADTFNLTVSSADAASIALRSTTGGIDLSTGTNSGLGAANLTLRSGGTLTIDTSAKNTDVLIQTGTGVVRVDGNLTFVGAQNITTTSDDLTLSPTGNLRIDTTGGVVKVSDTLEVGDGGVTNYASFSATGDLTLAGAANNLIANNDLVIRAGNSITIDTSANNASINLRAGTGGLTGSFGTANLTAVNDSASAVYLNSQRGGITLSSSNASGAGPIKILAGGSLQLSTSQGNQPIYLQAGTGNVNVSSNQLYLTGNLVVTGTETFNGVAYTFPGTQSASGVLLTDGSGILSWTTGLTGASLADDTLDFVDLQDELDLDADTTINGDYSLIIRSGLGSIQNSTSGSNDLQLSAEDKLILAGASFDLSTSSGGVDIISDSRIDLSGRGTLTLDTSQSNANIVLTPGSGNVGIGSTAPAYKLDVGGTLRTTSTARVEGALTVTTGGASVTGDLTLDGDLDFTGAQNITTTSDDLTLSPTGNLRIDTSGGTVKVSDTLEVGDGGVTNYASFSATGDLTLAGAANNLIANNDLVIRSGNSLTIDTSANNTNLVLQGGTGGLTGSFGTANLTAVNDSVSALYLNSQRGGITLSSANASGNGPVRILSGGSLQLSTSQGNQPIYLQAGTGNLNVSSSQLYLTGNLVVTGTETFNGVTYTFPGADGTSGQALTTNASGILSWSTTTPADDSLDFSQFEDSLDMDADTLVNGDYSLVLRAGAGGLQNSTSGSNDLQLAAEDKLIFDAASFTLTASSGPIDILSRGYLDLSSTGTLTLDTSQNNTNILLKAGTGSINLSSGTTTISGNVNLNSGTLTLNGVAYTFPGADGTSGQALSTNASGILSWSTIGVSADSLDFTDFKDTLTMDSDTAVNGDYSFILRAGLGAIQNSTSGSNDIQLAAEDRLDLYAGSYSLTTSGNSVDIYSGGRIDLSAKGTLTLDTSQNNSQILIRAGTGRVDVSGNTILVNAGTGTLTLSSSGGITIGGEGATTRVSGDLNFTGRLMEDGNEVLGNIIAAYNGSCPTGWTEYTAARGRTIVGTPASGTNAGTVGSALTDLQDKTHTHTGPSHTHTYTDVVAHTHAVDPPSTGTDSQGAHTHVVDSYQVSTINAHGKPATSDTGNPGSFNTNSSGAHTHSVDIASFTSGSTGVATGTTAASGTGATGTAATSDVIPYIQLTYCQKTAGADYAEWTRSREQYSPGTVVSADPQANEQIKITGKSYDSTMLGIISTAPGWTVGQQTPDSLQLALNGRVPVKIDPDSAPIKVGDFLTSSAKPGLAMKATKMGYTVGKALENWQPCSAVIPGEDPGSIEIDSRLRGNDNTSCGAAAITVFVNLGTYLGPLTADGYIDTRQNFIAGDIKVDLKKAVYQQLMSELNLPPNSSSNFPQNPLNSSNFPDPSDPSNPSFPSSPNTVSASVSQVLGVLADKLEESTASQSAQAADFDLLKSRVSSLEDLMNLIASASASPSSLDLLPSSLSLSTSSGANTPLTSSKSPLNSFNLSSSGDLPFSIQNSVFSILSSATVGGSLTVGLITIDDLDASINSLGETLKIQNQALADVEFLGGKIVMTKEGDVEIGGDLTVAGDVRFQGAIKAGDSVRGTNVPVAAGERELTVEFPAPKLTAAYAATVTPNWQTEVWVSAKQSDGFLIEFSEPAPAGATLDWIVIE